MLDNIKAVIDFLASYPPWVFAVSLCLAAPIVFLFVVFRPQAPTDPALVGDWTGLFREYRAADKAEAISNETVSISTRGNGISADLSGASGQRRSRRAQGQFEGDTLIFHYFAKEPQRGVGGSAFVLKGDPKGGLLKGYWLGYDPEQGKLMACPYVLGRNQDTEELKRNNLTWLQQPCYPNIQPTMTGNQRNGFGFGIFPTQAEYARASGGEELLRLLLKHKAAPITDPNRESIVQGLFEYPMTRIAGVGGLFVLPLLREK